MILINGALVGRYNQALGPQLRLFVPKTFFRIGMNRIIFVELDGLWLGEKLETTVTAKFKEEDPKLLIEFGDAMHIKHIKSQEIHSTPSPTRTTT